MDFRNFLHYTAFGSLYWLLIPGRPQVSIKSGFLFSFPLNELRYRCSCLRMILHGGPLGNFPIFDYEGRCQVYKRSYMILSHSHPACLGEEPASGRQHTPMPRYSRCVGKRGPTGEGRLGWKDSAPSGSLSAGCGALISPCADSSLGALAASDHWGVKPERMHLFPAVWFNVIILWLLRLYICLTLTQLKKEKAPGSPCCSCSLIQASSLNI